MVKSHFQPEQSLSINIRIFLIRYKKIFINIRKFDDSLGGSISGFAGSCGIMVVWEYS